MVTPSGLDCANNLMPWLLAVQGATPGLARALNLQMKTQPIMAAVSLYKHDGVLQVIQ